MVTYINTIMVRWFLSNYIIFGALFLKIWNEDSIYPQSYDTKYPLPLDKYPGSLFDMFFLASTTI